MCSFVRREGVKPHLKSLWAATFFIKSHRKWLKLDFSKVSLDQCDGLDNGMLYNLQRLQCGVPNPTPILPPPQQSSLSSHQWLWFYTRHNRGRRIYCRLRNGFKHTFHFSSNTSLRTHIVCVYVWSITWAGQPLCWALMLHWIICNTKWLAVCIVAGRQWHSTSVTFLIFLMFKIKLVLLQEHTFINDFHSRKT